MVAWSGIEPLTRGFSIQATAYVSTGLTQRILTVFWLPLTCAVTLTEPAAELFWSGRVYGHSVFRMESRQYRDRSPNLCRTYTDFLSAALG